jgi:hypothetical protein
MACAKPSWSRPLVSVTPDPVDPFQLNFSYAGPPANTVSVDLVQGFGFFVIAYVAGAATSLAPLSGPPPPLLGPPGPYYQVLQGSIPPGGSIGLTATQGLGAVPFPAWSTAGLVLLLALAGSATILLRRA